MNRPCPTTILCDDANPFANLSSEGPEPFWIPPQVAYWTRTGYCCDKTTLTVFSRNSAEDAAELLERTMATTCPKCDEPKKFCATADCPDGTRITEVCVDTSQSDADALAAAAKAAGLPYCDSLPFSATCGCPDGTGQVTVQSAVSQEVADAQCAAIPKHCDPPCNAPQTCIVRCPDGTFFSYTVPACAIVAETVELANAQAYVLACERANANRICLGPLAACMCKDTAFTGEIAAQGASNENLYWSIDGGVFPPGLNLLNGPTTDGKTIITGIPTVAGMYTFTIKALTSLGGAATKTYTAYVLEITTTSLPSYTVAQPYSYQLHVVGGSGNYSWSISSGGLPSGLTLSASGLISGTPTGADAGVMPIIFDVVDLACEQAKASAFPPNAVLDTLSSTITRTKHGWFAFGSSSGTLYKRIDATGSHTQIARTAPLVVPPSIGMAFCGGSKQTYGGYSEIDIYGTLIHLHDKLAIVACSKEPYPLTQASIVVSPGVVTWATEGNMATLLGYCWGADPGSCPTCSESESDWVGLNGNYAQANSFDLPWNMLIDDTLIVTTPTTLNYNGTAQRLHNRIVREDLSYPIGFPHGSTNVLAVDEPWVRIVSTGNFSLTLSEPFTDAEAESAKVVILGGGSVASGGITTQWKTQFINHIAVRTTNISFQIRCSNLVSGDHYTVTYQLWNQTTNAKTTITTTIIATGTTATISGTVPTPPLGQSVKITNVRIQKV